MFERFADHCRRHSLVVGGETLLVAVSGGIDSVTLLHLLRRLSERLPLVLHAAHLDHGLRLESAADADFVGELCRSWGVPLHVCRRELGNRASWRGEGPEAAARQARYDYLLTAADRVGASRIALGHHRDDQAETLLLRLVRGTGVTGMAGMAPVSGRLVRPLLPFSRREIETYAEAEGLTWREDASNRSTIYDRNHLRHEVMPLLELLNPRVGAALSALAEQAAREEDYWRQELDRLAEVALRTAGDGWRLDRSHLVSQPPALRLRFWHRLLAEVRGCGQGLARRHLAAVDELVCSAKPQGELHLPGVWVACRYGELWLRQRMPESPHFDVSLAPGEVVTLPCGGRLSARWDSARSETASLMLAEYDAEALQLPLTVRNRRPGDRLQLAGMEGRTQVKKLFGELRLTHEQRQRQPLVLSGEEILWLPGLRHGRGHRPAATCRQLLQLQWHPPQGERP